MQKNSRTNRPVCCCIGTTTVTVAVLDASETEIFKQDLKVKVKKNATDVTVTGIADGDSFKVGQTVEVTLPRAGVDTDERDLTVDKADNVEIKAGEKARVWSVKFLKAGELTFTAKAFQSTTYPGTTKDKAIKVTVANPAPTAVKVVASNAYELTFDTDVEAAGLFKDPKEIPNDACYYMINDTKVTQSAVSAVKATGNTVKVTMYDNFASGTTYYVVINGSDPMSFSIAGASAKDVTSIAILSDTAVVNTASEIKVALYNADGVDITESIKKANAFNVTLSSSNLNSYADGLTLNMYNVGDVTDLTATFVYYDANDSYKEVKKEITKKITAVAASADIFEKVVYTINGDGAQAETWMTSKNYVALGDDLDFKAIVTVKNGSNTRHIRVGVAPTSDAERFNGKNLIAWIPEEAVALLSAVDAKGCYGIQANTVGKTNVFIGYINDDGTTKTTVTVCPVEVKASRYPATLTVAPSKSNLNNHGEFPDSVTIKATVKDQYGDAVTNATFSVEQNAKSAESVPVSAGAIAANKWANNNDGTYSLTINDTDVTYGTSTKQGNVVLTTKLTNWNSKAASVGCNFSVKDDGNGQNRASDAIGFVNSGESKLDTTITGTTQFKAAKLAATTSRNGFYTGPVGFTVVGAIPTKTKTVTGPATSFELLIKKDGTIISGNLGAAANQNEGTVWSDFIDVNAGAGTINVINFYYSAGTIYKLPAGNYQFTLFKLNTADGKGAGEGVVSSQTVVINVADNQKAPVFTQISEEATYSKASTGDFSECFKFSFEGTEYIPSAGYTCGDAAQITKAYFVQKCNVLVTVNVEDKTGLGLGAGNFPGQLSKGLDCSINKLIKTK